MTSATPIQRRSQEMPATPPMPATLALYGAAYLYGSLPFVYVLGRMQRVDLRRIGSGNVGATNLLSAGSGANGTGKRAIRIGLAALGWTLDASKGLLPARMALQLGFSRRHANLAAVCGVAGQCWPLLLGLRGGRGISAFVGAAYAISPRAWTLTITPMIGGGMWRVAPLLAPLLARRFTGGAAPASLPESGEAFRRSKSVPLGCFLATLVFPLACALLDRPSSPIADRQHHTCAANAGADFAPILLSAIIVLRRLTAIQPDDATSGPRHQPTALLYRLLYDRNTNR